MSIERKIVICFGILIGMISMFYCYAEGMDDIFKEKVVIITGTSSGLGKAMAELAAEKKMKIVLVDINIPPSEKLVQNITEMGGKAIAIQVDLSKPEERGKIIDITMNKFGRIDYLINNAGYLYAAKVEDLELKQSHHLFEVNFWSYLDLAIRVVPIMRKQGGGTIVNIASIVALEAPPQRVGIYTASKRALLGIFETMASELRADNINIKIACPRGIKTNIYKNAVGPEKEVFVQMAKYNWELLNSPDSVAEDIFNKLNQKEVIILQNK